jgi:hypothetical protein
MGKLADLAKRLESLGTIPAEAIAAGAEYADRQIRNAGRAGGALRAGNAVAAKVEQQGLSMDIRRVPSRKGKFAYGIRADFLARWVADEVRRRIAERMGR